MSRRFARRLLPAGAMVALVVTLGLVQGAPVSQAAPTAAPRSTSAVFYVTLYGFVDTCTECSKDFNTKAGNGDNPVPPRNGHRWRIDLWAGGDKRSLHNPDKSALLNCEDALTQNNGGTVVLNPPNNEPVDTTPIYNVNTRKCFTP